MKKNKIIDVKADASACPKRKINNATYRGTARRDRNSTGITLIALIITIIILLILAGISINIAIGENGIFNKTKQSVEKYREEAAKEKVQLALSDWETKKIGNINLNFENFLKESFGEENVKAVDGEEDSYEVNVDGYIIKVNKENGIIEAEKGEGGNQEGEGTGGNEDVIEIKLDKNEIILAIFENNNTQILQATITPQNSEYTVEWTSNNEEIATVDENGKVTAKSAGTAIITAKIKDKDIIATCNVNVTDKICEFTEGKIYTNNTYGTTQAILNTSLQSLTDGSYYKAGQYGALMLWEDYNYLMFTLNANVNISFSSTFYSDSGGSSGKTAYFYKENDGNYDTLYYTLQQVDNSQKYGEYYFPAGRYKLYVTERYVEFDEWDFEIVN